MAVECHDYPQLFDVSASPGARLAQIASGCAGCRRDAFSPFDKATWFGAGLESYDWCVRWPRGTHAPDPPRPPGAAYPRIPTLVLDGDLDQRTSLIGARRVAAQFPDSTLVVVPNQGHVTALVDWMGCAAGIVRRFIATTRVSGSECAADNPALHLVEAFPRTSRTAPEAVPVVGDESFAHPPARGVVCGPGRGRCDRALSADPGDDRRRAARRPLQRARRLSLEPPRDPPAARRALLRRRRRLGQVLWHRRSGAVRATISFRTARASLAWSLATLDSGGAARAASPGPASAPLALQLTLPAP